jgi:hypothetical protein
MGQAGTVVKLGKEDFQSTYTYLYLPIPLTWLSRDKVL